VDSQILKLGSPLLRERSKIVEPAEFASSALRDLLKNLTSAMRTTHGIGIAAPQIGVRKRIFLMEVDNNPRYPDALALPLLILINPTLTPLTEDREEVYEGCLSIPGMRGPVKRVTKIRVDALDENGAKQSYEFQGPFARIALHESDHLDGILYFDRISAEDLSRFGFQQSLMESGVDLSIQRKTPAKWRNLS
jgi:peptide deformylase